MHRAGESYTDEELLAFFQQTQNRDYAFNLIVRKYQEKLYFHIRRLVQLHDDANDLVQDTFLKAWIHIDAFRADSSLFTWLYRIATNEALSFLRKQKIRSYLSLQSPEAAKLHRAEADPYFDGNKAEKLFRQAILSLPPRQQAVFNMRHFDELSYKQIADVLQLSEGGLKASYHLAVQKIEKKLTGI